MFGPLKTEIDTRFRNVEAYFAATKHFQGNVGAMAKGHMFVEVYAIYEHTVKAAVRTSIDSLNSRKHRLKDLSPSLLALYLDPELRSLKDAGLKNVWGTRQTFIGRAFSKDLAHVPIDTQLPDDGTHFRYSHLQLIMSVFNIRRRPVRKFRYINRINEVVGNRNEIAHGSDTAENVGRRYTRMEILHMLRQMESVCGSVVAVFDHYCSDATLHCRR